MVTTLLTNENQKQIFGKNIYSLGLASSETLKTYDYILSVNMKTKECIMFVENPPPHITFSSKVGLPRFKMNEDNTDYLKETKVINDLIPILLICRDNKWIPDQLYLFTKETVNETLSENTFDKFVFFDSNDNRIESVLSFESYVLKTDGTITNQVTTIDNQIIENCYFGFEIE